MAQIAEQFHGLRPHYKATLQSQLRGLLRRLGRPETSIGIPRAIGVQPREVTVPALELEAVLRAAPPALHLALLLARDAGLRVGTIVKLRCCDCDFERRLILGNTKNNRRFNVPMTQRLYERLLWTVAESRDPENTVLELLRPTRKNYGVDAMEVQLRRAKQTAKVQGNWTFHDLRRTTARDLYTATGDIRKVQRFLSHVHLRTTFWYIGNQAIDLSPHELEAATRQPKIKEEISA